MICLELRETGERLKLEHEIWVTTNRNGIIATPHRHLAEGVGDGSSIWSLGELEGYPEARIITLAEYLERPGNPVEDPELTDEELVGVLLGGGL